MRQRLTGKFVRATSHVVFEELPEGGLALLNSMTQQYFRLDPIGARMWTALLGNASIDAAASALLEEFDVEPDRLWQDLAELIGQLEHVGLVEVTDG